MEKKKTTTKAKPKATKKVAVKRTTTKKSSKKKTKKKGFTLIELLAVIIILGVLMIVAVPAVTSYIQNSRKSAYVNTAQNIVAGARVKVNDGTLGMYDTDTTYYIPYDMIKGENELKSPYGAFREAYVVATFNGKSYDYYWTSVDSTNTGMYLAYADSLDNDSIANDMGNIDTTIGVGNRSKIVVFNNDGTVLETKNKQSSISEKGSMNSGNGSGTTETSGSYFQFDEETGTIYGLRTNVTVVIDDYNACANFVYNDDWFDTLAEADDYCRNGIEDDLAQYPEDLEYLKENGAITSYEITGYPKDLVIPEEINGVPVVEIAYSVFAWTYVETVTIPKTVTTIASDAFNGVNNLYNIVNQTGRTFDWNDAFGNESNTMFEFGIVPGMLLGGNPVIISSSREQKIDIDYDGMFTLVGVDDHYLDLTLNKTDGYDVLYDATDSGNFTPMSVGETINSLNVCNARIRLIKNGQVYFDGLLTADRSECWK